MSSNYNILASSDQCNNVPQESYGRHLFNVLKERNPNDKIIVQFNSDNVLTSRDLLEGSIKMARVYEKMGLKKDDVVALITENVINYCIPVVAATYVGIATSFLNPAYKTNELIHALKLCKPKLIICSEKNVEAILAAKQGLSFIEKVILIQKDPKLKLEVDSINDLISAIDKSDVDCFTPADLDSMQTAFILQSSGTTGLPKAVLISHQNMKMELSIWRLQEYGNIVTNTRTILHFPFYHLFGLFTLLLGIATPLELVLLHTFQPDTYLEAIKKYKITTLYLIPSLLHFLCKSSVREDVDLSTLNDMLVTTGPVGESLRQEASKRLGHARLRQTYGLTETTGACTMPKIGNRKPGSVGTLVPNVLAKVWDSKNQKSVGPLVVGELCFKSQTIMKGYANDTEATKSSIDDDGFFHTGDLGYFDNDGDFYIVGRMKEMIKCNGYQVAPAELEGLLLTHPDVVQCGVIGIPDEWFGEVPFAFIVKRAESNLGEAEIVDFVAERISVQKRLHRGVRFVKEIPSNTTGKVIRRKLLELWHAGQA